MQEFLASDENAHPRCLRFLSFPYLCFAVVTNFFNYMGFITFMALLAKYLTLKDGFKASEYQSAMVVSVLGFASIPGRIFLGWICNFDRVKSELVMMLCSFGCAVAIGLTVILDSMIGEKNP